MSRIYLNVPYADKDQARRAGARWDPHVRKWYVEGRTLTPFMRWLADEDKPSVEQFDADKAAKAVPSSERMKGVVPRKAW